MREHLFQGEFPMEIGQYLEQRVDDQLKHYAGAANKAKAKYNRSLIENAKRPAREQENANPAG